VQHFNHTSAANSALRDAQNRSYQIAKLSQPAAPVQPVGDEWTPCMKLPVVVHVRKQRPGESHVSTREGITPVKPDDLIMRGVSGEEYPIGRAIFEQTYTLDTTKPAAHPAPVQKRSALTLDRPMTFGGCPFCGSQSCVAGQCRSATAPAAQPAPVRVPDKHLQLALEALAPLEKLFTQADEQGLLAGANVDCQIATNDLRKSAYAASDIRTHLNTPPAQPAVPDAITDNSEDPEYRAGWNECRETMLQILKARTL
jgi:hypothetical protein